MKRILISIFLIGISISSYSKVQLVGDWKIDFLVGIDNANEFLLSPPDSGSHIIWGNSIHLQKDGTFYCDYSAPCGLDCFRSSYGTFNWIDSNRIQFHINKIMFHGTCGNKQDSVDITLTFRVWGNAEKVRLIKSNSDPFEDLYNAEYSQYIDDYIQKRNGHLESERHIDNTHKIKNVEAIVIACLRDKYQKSDKIEILYTKDVGYSHNDRKIVLFTHNGVRKLVRLYPHSHSAELIL